MFRFRSGKRPEASSKRRSRSSISVMGRFLGGLVLVLAATGASAGLLDLLRKPSIELKTGLLDLSLEELILNTSILGLIELEIDVNQVIAVLTLPGGIETDLIINFDRVIGLNEDSLGLSASELDPEDPALLQRLPAGAMVIPQADFPMLIEIEPVDNFAFANDVELEIHTHNLEFTPGTRLRLFAAAHGEAFRDITTYVGPGSYRSRGRRGKFSEFLVVEDNRDTDTVIATKFDYLRDLLEGYRGDIPPYIYWVLRTEINSAKNAWNFDDDDRATDLLDSAIETVNRNRGLIPNVWHPNLDMKNVAGEFTAAAQTLIFSLDLPD